MACFVAIAAGNPSNHWELLWSWARAVFVIQSHSNLGVSGSYQEAVERPGCMGTTFTYLVGGGGS